MWTTLLDALLPMRCAACGRLGQGLCGACRYEADALRLADGGTQRLAPGVIALAAYRYDGVIAQAIRDVKTPGRHAAARPLGELMWAQVAPLLGSAAHWVRTWVPATPARLRARGADIPRALAGPGAVGFALRVSQASDQRALSGPQRRVARTHDFEPCGSAPRDVVLVDDVRTTGATALAVARTLAEAGARRVAVVTLAAVVRDDVRGRDHSPRHLYDA